MNSVRDQASGTDLFRGGGSFAQVIAMLAVQTAAAQDHINKWSKPTTPESKYSERNAQEGKTNVLREEKMGTKFGENFQLLLLQIW